MKIQLKRSFVTHTGEVSTIDIREPTAGDYMALGTFPFNVKGEGADRTVVMDFKLAGKWLARLSGIDEILLSKMSGKDFQHAIGQLSSVFADEVTEGNAPA